MIRAGTKLLWNLQIKLPPQSAPTRLHFLLTSAVVGCMHGKDILETARERAKQHMRQNPPDKKDENMALEKHDSESAPGGSRSNKPSGSGLALLRLALLGGAFVRRSIIGEDEGGVGTATPLLGAVVTTRISSERSPGIRLGGGSFSYVAESQAVLQFQALCQSLEVTREASRVKMNTLTKKATVRLIRIQFNQSHIRDANIPAKSLGSSWGFFRVISVASSVLQRTLGSPFITLAVGKKLFGQPRITNVTHPLTTLWSPNFDSEAPPGRVVRVTFARAKDLYCFCCEDGGRIIDCSNIRCHRVYCYNIIGTPNQQSESPEVQSCISITPELFNKKSWAFRCPECTASDPLAEIDYIINRGSRNTRRLSFRTSVAMVVYYLSKWEEQANALINQLHSALAGFEVHVILQVSKLPGVPDVEEVARIHQELRPEAPYHLAVVFFTEGTPGGGWWYSADKDPEGPFQATENSFLKYCLKPLKRLATDAVTSRVFGVACGMNLAASPVAASIHKGLDSRPWHSILLPTTGVLMASAYVNTLPELFLELYYFSSPLRSAALRVWAKSRETRAHTGLLLMERSDWKTESLYVSRFEHAPPESRPIGVRLPMVDSLCGCWDSEGTWSRRYQSKNHGEHFFYYGSTCCSVELHIAIYEGRRQILNAHGTTIVEETWDSEQKKFTFDRARMVTMLLSGRERRGSREAKASWAMDCGGTMSIRLGRTFQDPPPSYPFIATGMGTRGVVGMYFALVNWHVVLGGHINDSQFFRGAAPAVPSSFLGCFFPFAPPPLDGPTPLPFFAQAHLKFIQDFLHASIYAEISEITLRRRIVLHAYSWLKMYNIHIFGIAYMLLIVWYKYLVRIPILEKVNRLSQTAISAAPKGSRLYKKVLLYMK
ncbi:hypothetical protein BDV93DRAFT_513685 [Ceratobasidium sp. AG-I]|nr:hypothetical protein BDV93DRAFT_513685 [Ceratobasidium sp. AG-I]